MVLFTSLQDLDIQNPVLSVLLFQVLQVSSTASNMLLFSAEPGEHMLVRRHIFLWPLHLSELAGYQMQVFFRSNEGYKDVLGVAWPLSDDAPQVRS